MVKLKVVSCVRLRLGLVSFVGRSLLLDSQRCQFHETRVNSALTTPSPGPAARRRIGVLFGLQDLVEMYSWYALRTKERRFRTYTESICISYAMHVHPLSREGTAFELF